MLPSQIDLHFIKNYLRIDQDNDLDDMELSLYLTVARSYIENYTGYYDYEIDENPEFSIVILMLVAHFYENKTIVADKSTTDYIFNSILAMHRR